MKPIKHISVDEQIHKNRHKAWFVIVLFILIVILFSVGCTCIYDILANPDAQIDIVSVSIIMTVITIVYVTIMVLNSRKILLFLNHAVPLSNRNQAPILYDVVQEMAIAFGLPTNRIGICITNDYAPNAFSLGNLRQTNHGWRGQASIGATAGLSKLNRSELTCVIGHEMAHVKDEDTRLESIGVSLMLLFSIISKICYSIAWRTTNASRDNDYSDNDDYSDNTYNDTNNSSNIIFDIFAEVFVIVLVCVGCLGWLCSGLCHLTQLCLSKSRDYLADALSVKMTQDPLDLINALVKVNQAPRITSANPTSNSIYFESIFPEPKHTWSPGNLFDSHPSVKRRIYHIEQIE